MRVELLDVQIVDADDVPIGRVDDLEIDLGAEVRSEAPGGRLADLEIAPPAAVRRSSFFSTRRICACIRDGSAPAAVTGRRKG